MSTSQPQKNKACNSINANLAPGWKELIVVLQNIPATRPGGFEYFAADLLSSITGNRFAVALSGEQPTADAINSAGQVCLQAKRYLSSTSLKIDNIETNITKARRSAPALEVYVAAVTRDAAQLRDRLRSVEEETGLDIVLLDAAAVDDSGMSALAALVIAHWEAVSRYFSNQLLAWTQWVESQKTNPNVACIATRTAHEIKEGWRTQTRLHHLTAEKLKTRFTSSSTAINGQAIDLSRAIPRPDIQKKITKWWQQTDKPNAYVHDEEGRGKTWAVAAFALSLTADHVSVLWLESKQWSGSQTIEAILHEGLKSVLPEGDPCLNAFARKVFCLWQRPLLFILDGVNEHACLESAQKILHHCQDHASHFATRIRFLFTTRPLEQRPEWERKLWGNCCSFSVGPFSQNELAAALQLHAPGVTIHDIPANVHPLVCEPRYFQLCLKLKDRMHGLGLVTKPLLLFVDLQEKMERGDPATRKLYGGCILTNAKSILAYLAKNTQTKLETGWKIERKYINNSFPHLDKTLHELAEEKVILEKKPDSVVVQNEHVELGFALHLLEIGTNSRTTNTTALVEELCAELEPNREQDSKGEALYLALLLTCLPDTDMPTAADARQRLRVALLHLWWNHHNAKHDTNRIDFWGQEDMVAYAAAMEEIFATLQSSALEHKLVRPLARQWISKDADRKNILRKILKHWLALVYTMGVIGESAEEQAERARFPQAKTSRQLRLSSVAMSILSIQPEIEMLPDLAWMASSMDFCMRPYPGNKSERPMPLKNLHDMLNVLIRWCYGEEIVGKCEDEVRNCANDETKARGFRILAQSTRIADLPLSLSPKATTFQVMFRDQTPLEKFHEFQEWIAGLPNASSTFPYSRKVERLAVRADLPDLSITETDRLIPFLKEQPLKGTEGAIATRMHLNPFSHTIVWIARSLPDQVCLLYASYLHHLLSSQHPRAIISEPIILLNENDAGQLVDVCIAKCDALKKKDMEIFQVRLTSIILISTSEVAWLRWFDYLCNYSKLKEPYVWKIIPSPWILEKVATKSFCTAVRARYEQALSDLSPRDGGISLQALFWLELLTYCAKQDILPLAKWAQDQLRTLDSDDPRTKSYIRMVAMSGDADIIETVLCDEQLMRHLRHSTLVKVFNSFIVRPKARNIEMPFCDVQNLMPLPLAYGFLRITSDDSNLIAYAKTVAQRALTRIKQKPEHRPRAFISSFTITKAGDVLMWSIEDPEKNKDSTYLGQSVIWGVNYDENTFRKIVESMNESETALYEINSEITYQNERIDKIPDNFLIHFNGAETLHMWAEKEPAEYRFFCETFFTQLRQDRGHLFDIGAFAHALLKPLYFTHFDWVRQLHKEFFTRQETAIFLIEPLDAFVADLWRNEYNSIDGIAAARRASAEECKTDLGLLSVSIAAALGGTTDKLEEFITDTWLNDDKMSKQRALAVTLIAFSANAKWLPCLKELIKTDPSKWVRNQAKWAVEVLEQSLFMRKIWDEICKQSVETPSAMRQLSARLVRLHDILFPMAHAWPKPDWEGKGWARADALMLTFREHWRSSSTGKGESEIADRKLADYCRGISLSNDGVRRLAPWWNPLQ